MPQNKIKPALLVLPVLSAAVLLTGCSAVAAIGGGPDLDHDAAQGGVPEGVTITPFDVRYPAVGNLDPDLRKAVQEAASAARERNIEFRVTSGWRTKAYQQKLLDDAVDKYGSLDKARRYVSTPEESKHVSGKAVDIGPTNADDWLIQHGKKYGLCQVYSNEMWHFELLAERGGACPPLLSNAAG